MASDKSHMLNTMASISVKVKNVAHGVENAKFLRLLGGSRQESCMEVAQGDGCLRIRPVTPTHPVYRIQAVARFQAKRDWHGGNFASPEKEDFLPLEWRYGLRDNRNFKPGGASKRHHLKRGYAT